MDNDGDRIRNKLSARKVLEGLLRLLLRLAKHNPFIFLWAVNLIIFEVLSATWIIGQCNIPKDGQRIAVIADPQLTDAYSYGQQGTALSITQFYSDLYMKRNFRILQEKHKPDGVIFLGDLMDGGREWSDNQTFQEELERLYNVFKLRNKSMFVWWAAGNHDIGFGDEVIPKAYDRFVATFGPPNQAHTINGISIITLDTVSLSGSNSTVAYQKALSSLESIPKNETLSEQRILVTHVPLFRPEGGACGGLRRHPVIRQGGGYQYQNLVKAPLSAYILETIRPSLVLSGDDHDWCEYHHSPSITEWTIATFSWMQGNWYPGYGILHLPASSSSSVMTPRANPTLIPCPLPGPLPTYLYYARCFLFTLLLAPLYAYCTLRSSYPTYIELPLYGVRRRPYYDRADRVCLGKWKGVSIRKVTSRAGRLMAECVIVGIGVYAVCLLWLSSS
ncbi:Metallo-dependent phosphatase-like protein [Gaertneriomyces semiglobifer]|nr:Metallo-dependent phosphatase-like protein [Gaertneriomyces semiglobifer]